MGKRGGPQPGSGRPLKEISQEQFEGMCFIQATKDEICHVLKVEEKTLTRWCKRTYGKGFADIFKKLSSGGKMSLRRAMFNKATKDKNVTMMIWLSKQYLGMADRTINEDHEYHYEDPAFLKDE